MTTPTQKHLKQVLHHLYINPLEKCNLRCKICYTKKTDPILTEAQIVEFVKRYTLVQKLKMITFCGGEVFALSYFPKLINVLTKQGIFIQVITNGTIDKLVEIENPNSVNLIVSIDGLEQYHDANRGVGNYKKSMKFLQNAKQLGFHTEIFSIITRQNLPALDAFETMIKTELKAIPVTYHPRKPPAYLSHHPLSNIVGETVGFDFLTKEEMQKVVAERNVFPPKALGCYQIALTSTGKVYGCCEGTIPIGNMTDNVTDLIANLTARIVAWEKLSSLKNCLGCSQPDFVCGIKEYLK